MHIPQSKWENIAMDFMVSFKDLRKTLFHLGNSGLVDEISSLLPSWVDYSSKHLDKIYNKDIVKLHRVILTIISNRGMTYTSKFWGWLYEELDLSSPLVKTSIIKLTGN